MFDQLVCRVMFHQLRYEGIFTYAGPETGTLVHSTATLGMFEWTTISVDPEPSVAIANRWRCRFVSKADHAAG